MNASQSIALLPTDALEIKNIISEIKPDVACGADHISMKVIKSVSEDIAPVLSRLINYSLSLGFFPDALKIAKVIPVYKTGDKSRLNNYRPISLLNCFSKIYEKVILKRLL